MNKNEVVIYLLKQSSDLNNESVAEHERWFGSIGKANSYLGAAWGIKWAADFIDKNLTEM